VDMIYTLKCLERKCAILWVKFKTYWPHCWTWSVCPFWIGTKRIYEMGKVVGPIQAALNSLKKKKKNRSCVEE